MFFKRYDKKVIEEFAIRTIRKSFDDSYGLYILPNDTNNFDSISPDNRRALEITLVVSKNNMEGYIYEKLFAQGKPNLEFEHIKNYKTNSSGKLLQWQGGPIEEISNKIQQAINQKEEKARKRLSKKQYDSIDLCICIDDGGYFDAETFGNINFDIGDIFTNIFYITSSLFLRYTKQEGIKQYKRIIE